MSIDAKPDHARDSGSNRSSGAFAAFFSSPILWGGLMTGGFYGLVPQSPIYRGTALRYFCGHPIEYATTAMFFMAIAILIGKGFALMAERSALSHDLLPNASSANSTDIIALATGIDAQRRALPPRLRETAACERIRAACSFVRDRHTSKGLDEHLQNASQIAHERLHRSHSLIRTTT